MSNNLDFDEDSTWAWDGNRLRKWRPRRNTAHRKLKRKMLRFYNQLEIGNGAIACNGHPGIVVKKGFSYQDLHGAYVEIQSLLSDDIVCSCSIYHCRPEPISLAYADWLRDDFNRLASATGRSIMALREQWEMMNVLQIESWTDSIRNAWDQLDQLAVTDQKRATYEAIINGLRALLDGDEEIPMMDLGYRGETFRW